MSISDALTDAMLHTVPLDQAGKQWGFDGEGHFCHSGFLACAENIRNQFQRHQVLHKLFGIEAKAKARSSMNEDDEDDVDVSQEFPDCSAYRLVICGHSLGAAIAAVLALLLRPEFPQLECIAYSAPGCVFDMELAEEVKSWCTVPFVGKDLVPRLSWHTLTRLRAQFLDVLRRSKANKNKIIKSIATTIPLDDLLYKDNEEVPNTPERMRLLDQIKELESKSKTSDQPQFARIEMWPPGKLLHFARTSKTKSKSIFPCTATKTEFKAAWIEDKAEMREISISHRLLFDHMPDYDVTVMTKVYEDMKTNGQGSIDLV